MYYVLCRDNLYFLEFVSRLIDVVFRENLAKKKYNIRRIISLDLYIQGFSFYSVEGMII